MRRVSQSMFFKTGDYPLLPLKSHVIFNVFMCTCVSDHSVATNYINLSAVEGQAVKGISVPLTVIFKTKSQLCYCDDDDTLN